jgi:Spy/CpxP family protein refolding chaperone
MRYALVAAALLVGATAAYAGGPGCGHGSRMDKLTADLNLDDTQAAQVEEILKSSHERMRAQHEAIHEETLAQLRGVLTEEQIQTLQARWERHGPKRARMEEGV